VAPTTFFDLRVSDIRRETDDTVSLALDVPDELAGRFEFMPGQFLTFRVDGADGTPVRRSYSICSTPADGELRVVVKRLAGGVFGEMAHTTLAVGDSLATLPPLGRFTTPVDATHAKAYLAVAAGSGISPVMSVIRSVLASEPDSRVTLVYGNRGAASVIFRDALSDLKDLYLQRLQLIYVFSRESQDAALLNGRIDADKLRALAKGLIDIPGFDAAFVCGPEPMTLEARQTLIDLGMDAGQIHLELYGSHVAKPARPAAASDEADVRVEVVLGGRRQTVAGRHDETVLDAVNAAGLDAPFSCTGGVCATCRARVVTGQVEMAANYSLEPWELDAGFVLTCQARPTTDAVTIDYDAV
jgi:ring-1,2-phenylacetyl-CoA epoxidase subunit PaaE